MSLDSVFFTFQNIYRQSIQESLPGSWRDCFMTDTGSYCTLLSFTHDNRHYSGLLKLNKSGKITNFNLILEKGNDFKNETEIVKKFLKDELDTCEIFESIDKVVGISNGENIKKMEVSRKPKSTWNGIELGSDFYSNNITNDYVPAFTEIITEVPEIDYNSLIVFFHDTEENQYEQTEYKDQPCNVYFYSANVNFTDSEVMIYHIYKDNHQHQHCDCSWKLVRNFHSDENALQEFNYIFESESTCVCSICQNCGSTRLTFFPLHGGTSIVFIIHKF